MIGQNVLSESGLSLIWQGIYALAIQRAIQAISVINEAQCWRKMKIA